MLKIDCTVNDNDVISKINGLIIEKLPKELLNNLIFYSCDLGQTEIGDWKRLLSGKSFNIHKNSSDCKKILFDYFHKYGDFNEIELRQYSNSFNSYLPPHIDMVNHTSHDNIIMINVLGKAILSFNDGNTLINIHVGNGDVLILTNDARFKWFHSLQVISETRYSIIIRNVNKFNGIKKNLKNNTFIESQSEKIIIYPNDYKLYIKNNLPLPIDDFHLFELKKFYKLNKFPKNFIS